MEIVTSFTAAQALLDHVASHIDAVNAFTARQDGSKSLASLGYPLSLEAPSEDVAERDSSPYERLKIGDRERISDGLTVCFIPNDDEDIEDTAPWGGRVHTKVDILCYVRGEPDPQKVMDTMRAVAESLSSLLNAASQGAYSLALPGGLSAEAAKIRRRTYAGVQKEKMREIIPAAILYWDATSYLSE